MQLHRIPCHSRPLKTRFETMRAKWVDIYRHFCYTVFIGTPDMYKVNVGIRQNHKMLWSIRVFCTTSWCFTPMGTDAFCS